MDQCDITEPDSEQVGPIELYVICEICSWPESFQHMPEQNENARSVLWNERGPGATSRVGYCLAISWLSPSCVIGRHRTLSPASASRKGMISNDDDRSRHREGRG